MSEVTPITAAEEKKEQQRREAIRRTAKNMREFYEALVLEGFDEEQALTLISWSREE